MNGYRENLEGAACAELPPQAIQRYFEASFHTDRKNMDIARRICAACPVIQECLQQAINGERVVQGVTAGMAATKVNNLRKWKQYDLGFRDTPPPVKRPEIDIPDFPSMRTEAYETMEDYRRKVDFSFEERVYEVFQGIRDQRITKINDAISQIALIHGDFMRTGTNE